MSPACKDKLDERLTREFLYNTPKHFHLLRNANLSELDKHLDLVKGRTLYSLVLRT